MFWCELASEAGICDVILDIKLLYGQYGKNGVKKSFRKSKNYELYRPERKVFESSTFCDCCSVGGCNNRAVLMYS